MHRAIDARFPAIPDFMRVNVRSEIERLNFKAGSSLGSEAHRDLLRMAVSLLPFRPG